MRAYWVFLVCLILSSHVSAFGKNPVKIGFLFFMSGRMGSFGSIAVQGCRMALKELNAKGGINGRRVIGIFEDSAGDPDRAADLFKKLVRKDQVAVVIGVHSNPVAIRLAQLTKDFGTPLIITGAQTAVVTGRECNRFIFRLCPNSRQTARIAALLARWTEASKWTTIASDNLGNREMWTFFKRNLKEMKPAVSFVNQADTVFLRHSEVDWKSALNRVVASNADGLLISLMGGSFLEFVREGHKYGLFRGKRELVVVTASLSELLGLGHDMPGGIWWSTPYWFQASRSPVNLNFAQEYEKKYGAPPSWQAQFAYAAVKVYAEAAEKAGTTDPEAIVSVLEGFTTEIPLGKVTIRAADHQAIMHGMAGKTARMTVTARKFTFRGLGSMILFRPKEIEDPSAVIECRLK